MPLDLVRAAGLDPRRVTLAEVLGLVDAEARMYSARVMAAVKLDKAEILVTLAEAQAVLDLSNTNRGFDR